MKLSIVILCWNDAKVISDCLRSIYQATHETSFEVIVSDNGSTDGSVDLIRANFPLTRVVENRDNLGFAKGNNAGIQVSQGEWVLILNPDTIIHDRAFDRLITFAERHPEAGACGCRVVSPDGSYQVSARPFPTIRRQWLAALYLRPLAYLSDALTPDIYVRWHGDTERAVDWQSGCCVLFRGQVLRDLGGFDGQFFYQLEEVDLCRRVHDAGYAILFTPSAVITHLGGQSVRRFPIRFALEKYRSRYRYFYKHYGPRDARQCRQAVLASIRLRQAGYSLINLLRPSDCLRERLEMYRAVAAWNKALDPVGFVTQGTEPDLNRLLAGSAS
jgi:N-acetylglucosaminyl-diphospho-decaprenol L-rhamnosyltransferase